LLRGVQAIGGLVAGMLIATVASRAAPATLVAAGTLTLGVASAVIWNLPALTTDTLVYLVLFGAVGAPGVFLSAGALTIIQSAAEPGRAGRVLSSTFAGMAAGQTVGSLVVGTLGAEHLTVLLDVQASLLLAAGVVAAMWLRRPDPAAHADDPGRPVPPARADLVLAASAEPKVGMPAGQTTATR
jgi:MFS family permease